MNLCDVGRQEASSGVVSRRMAVEERILAELASTFQEQLARILQVEEQL